MTHAPSVSKCLIWDALSTRDHVSLLLITRASSVNPLGQVSRPITCLTSFSPSDYPWHPGKCDSDSTDAFWDFLSCSRHLASNCNLPFTGDRHPRKVDTCSRLKDPALWSDPVSSSSSTLQIPSKW